VNLVSSLRSGVRDWHEMVILGRDVTPTKCRCDSVLVNLFNSGESVCSVC